jgi:Ca2+-binding RTX toxin-like protein
MEARASESGTGAAIETASSTLFLGRVVDLSGVVGTRTVLIRDSAQPVTFDHVPLGARLLLNNAGQSTTVHVDEADGPDDQVTVEVLGPCGRLILDRIEHVTLQAQASGEISLDAHAVRTLTLDSRRPLTIDLSDLTLAHLERVDASASQGRVRFIAEEAKALEVTGGRGPDMIKLSGDRGNRITTGAGDDDIATGSGDDIIDLGPGDDIVDAGGGVNLITTGRGRDTIVMSAAGNSSLAGQGAGVTTVTDFDGEGGDKLWFKFAPHGRVADAAALAMIERTVDALDPSTGLSDALHAAQGATAENNAGWFVWRDVTYVFIDDTSDTLVLLQGAVPLSEVNFLWGE